MLWIFLAILTILGIIGISVWKSQHTTKLERMRVNGKSKGYNEDEIEQLIAAEEFPLPGYVRTGLIVLTVAFMGLGTFNKIFFYAEPGYVYHVRTILGEERVVDSVGYSYYLFGRVNNWKKAMTVQAVPYQDLDGDGRPDIAQAEGETTGGSSSASLPPLSVVMLDQVDSKISATTRFRIPTDRETFLKMAHEYRTPENLLNTALVPAFKETLQATGSLMAAEEYYSGRRTEFNAEFENQMQNGIYLVTRHQVQVEDPTAVAPASADGSALNAGGDVTTGGTKTKWVVEKKTTATGTFVRKEQKFTDYSIQVIEARVTDLVPNKKFVERMQLKQQAAADRAIAQEKRVQEEEQRLLAIAKGEREVAEQQAEAKKVQIKQTTEAETDKRLTLIAANKELEQAEVQKQTAAVQLERDQIKAESVKVLADAEAYKKAEILSADNALAQKLETEIEIQKVWAAAYAKRAVPQYVIGGAGGEGAGTPVGADGEVKNFMQLMTIDAAKRLNYDRGINPASKQ